MEKEKVLSEILKESSERARKLMPNQDIPNSPNALAFFKWYKDEIIWANSQIDSIEESYKIKNSCVKGCSSCCKQPIGVLPTEMLGIQQFLKNQTMEERKRLLNLALDTCNRIIESGVKTNISQLRTETSIHNQMAKYFDLDIRCPLLSDNNTCLVYDVRPINCWSYRMYGDPKDCDISHNPDYGVKYDDWELVILKRILKARMTQKDKVILLPFALRDMLKQMV